VRKQVLCPHKTVSRVTISYTVVFVFLDRKPEKKYSEPTISRHFSNPVFSFVSFFVNAIFIF
jgi:hypothetical protein